jgi:hypothetical protein
LRLADAVLERMHVRIIVHDRDRISRSQLIELLACAAELPDIREISEAETQLAKNPIERVVLADHEFCGLPQCFGHWLSAEVIATLQRQVAGNECGQRDQCITRLWRLRASQRVKNDAANQREHENRNEQASVVCSACSCCFRFVVESDARA